MLMPLSKSHDCICVGLFLDCSLFHWTVSLFIQVLYCLNYFRIIISLGNHQLEDICFSKSYKSVFLSQGSLDYSRFCFSKSYKSVFLSQVSLDYSRSSWLFSRLFLTILDPCFHTNFRIKLSVSKKNLLEFWLKLDWLHILIWEV